MEVFPLIDLIAQLTLIQQKTTGTLEYSSGAVISWPTSLKKARDEIFVMSGKHGKQLPTERARSDCVRAQVTDLTS